MASHDQTDVLRKGGPDCVVRRGGEGHVEDNLAHGDDKPPTIKDRVFVTDGCGENRTKPRPEVPLTDLVEGEALHEVFQAGHGNGRCGRLGEMQAMERARDEQQEALGGLRCLALKPRASHPIIVGHDINGHREGGARVPIRVCWSGVLCGFQREVDGSIPQLLRLLATLYRMAVYVLEEVRHIHRGALVLGDLHSGRGRWCQERGFMQGDNHNMAFPDIAGFRE